MFTINLFYFKIKIKKELGQSLIYLTHFSVSFSVGDNNLGSEGGKYLGDALQVNTTLTTLR